MSVFEESDIRFDFGIVVPCRRHDEANRIFPGVDFIIEEPARDLYLEIKNWEGSSMPARRRGGQRRSFLAKLRSREFFKNELRAKLTGTIAYLALTGNAPRRTILYIALLESPRMDSALMLHATDRLKSLTERATWHIPVNAAVMNLSEWNKRFPQYPAVPL